MSTTNVFAAPQTNIINPLEGASLDAEYAVTLGFSINDTTVSSGSYIFYIDDVVNTSSSWNNTVQTHAVDFVFGEGTYNVTIEATDDLGNYSNTSVSFSVSYPQTTYLTYQNFSAFGTSGADSGNVVYVDSNNNTYLGGYFTQGTIDFDPTENVDNHTNPVSALRAFLSKYDADGNYLWTRSWGGTGNTYVNSRQTIVVTAAGDVYVVGEFLGTADFDPTGSEFNVTSSGSTDAFMSKFSSDGVWQWTKTWGGSDADRALTILLDADENIYVSGRYRTTVDFDPGVGEENHTSAGNYDAYVSFFYANESFGWVRVWGGSSGVDSVEKMSLDSNNDLYLTGHFTGTVDFDFGAGQTNKTAVGNYDAYLTKHYANGTLAWVNTWGGTAQDLPIDIGINSENEIYVVGSQFSTNADYDPGAGEDNKTNPGVETAFLTKYDADGNYLLTNTWSSQDRVQAVTVDFDSDDNYYISGLFSGVVDFDPATGALKTPVTNYGMYVSKFYANDSYALTRVLSADSTVQWFYYYPSSVHVTDSLLYMAGVFSQTIDADPGVGVAEYAATGTADIFFTKYVLSTTTSSEQSTTSSGGSSRSSAKLLSLKNSLRTLTPGSDSRFKLSNGETHRVVVSKIKPTSVLFIFYSQAQEIELTIGDSQLVDLSGNGFSDVNITLHSIGTPQVSFSIEPLVVKLKQNNEVVISDEQEKEQKITDIQDQKENSQTKNDFVNQKNTVVENKEQNNQQAQNEQHFQETNELEHVADKKDAFEQEQNNSSTKQGIIWVLVLLLFTGLVTIFFWFYRK